MVLKIEEFDRRLFVWEGMAQFGKPLDQNHIAVLTTKGFAVERARCVGCIGWVWAQWLKGASVATVRERITPFVERGIEIQRVSSQFSGRPLFDLYLLHCAIFGGTEAQVNTIAERAIDASGLDGTAPKDDGDLYASAWTGMLKYWILGIPERALQESEVVWGAYRHPSFRAAAKPLVRPWLERNWQTFKKEQQKDFSKRWERSENNRTVISKNGAEAVINFRSYSIEESWCWAHCGMALLAHRQGAEVATDELWFPPSALKAVGQA